MELWKGCLAWGMLLYGVPDVMACSLARLSLSQVPMRPNRPDLLIREPTPPGEDAGSKEGNIDRHAQDKVNTKNANKDTNERSENGTREGSFGEPARRSGRDSRSVAVGLKSCCSHDGLGVKGRKVILQRSNPNMRTRSQMIRFVWKKLSTRASPYEENTW